MRLVYQGDAEEYYSPEMRGYELWFCHSHLVAPGGLIAAGQLQPPDQILFVREDRKVEACVLDLEDSAPDEASGTMMWMFKSNTKLKRRWWWPFGKHKTNKLAIVVLEPIPMWV